MAKDVNRWVRGIRDAKRRQAMPIMTYPGLALVGLTVRDVVTRAKSQSECIQALAERYPSVAAMTLMDLSVEAEAFGCPVRCSDEDVPTVTGPIIHDLAGAQALTLPSMESGRMPVYLEAARLAADSIAGRPTLGGMIGPFSLTVRLRDMTEVMMDLLIQPELIHAILERCTAFLIEYARAYKQHGADGILIAEPAAGLISPEHGHAFSSVYIRRIVEAVQDDRFAVVLHNCGNAAGLVASMLSTGVRGMHFGNAVNLPSILPQVPPEVLVFGNIDPARVFRHGSPESVREATLGLLRAASTYGNFVLSSGCDIPPGTPLQNIDAFFDALDEFNAHEARSS